MIGFFAAAGAILGGLSAANSIYQGIRANRQAKRNAAYVQRQTAEEAAIAAREEEGLAEVALLETEEDRRQHLFEAQRLEYLSGVNLENMEIAKWMAADTLLWADREGREHMREIGRLVSTQKTTTAASAFDVQRSRTATDIFAGTARQGASDADKIRQRGAREALSHTITAEEQRRQSILNLSASHNRRVAAERVVENGLVNIRIHLENVAAHRKVAGDKVKKGPLPGIGTESAVDAALTLSGSKAHAYLALRAAEAKAAKEATQIEDVSEPSMVRTDTRANPGRYAPTVFPVGGPGSPVLGPLVEAYGAKK